jgi:hypothetical protein
VIEQEKTHTLVTLEKLEASEVSSVNLSEKALMSQLAWVSVLGRKWTISKSPSWNPWRSVCMEYLSVKSLMSISVSSLKLAEGYNARVMSANGTHNLLYISEGCCVLLDRSMNSCRLVPVIKVSMDSGTRFYLLGGYMSENSFMVITSASADSRLRISESKLDTESLITLPESAEFKIKHCEQEKAMGNNWKVAYPGNQSSIVVIKRPKNQTFRPLSRESVISLVHKLVVHCLVVACSEGLSLKVAIVCRPFSFFKPLTDLCHCMFIYPELWEEASGEDLEAPSYSPYENEMNVVSSGDMTRCINYMEPGIPVHFNSSLHDLDLLN